MSDHCKGHVHVNSLHEHILKNSHANHNRVEGSTLYTAFYSKPACVKPEHSFLQPVSTEIVSTQSRYYVKLGQQTHSISGHLQTKTLKQLVSAISLNPSLNKLHTQFHEGHIQYTSTHFNIHITIVTDNADI